MLFTHFLWLFFLVFLLSEVCSGVSRRRLDVKCWAVFTYKKWGLSIAVKPFFGLFNREHSVGAETVAAYVNAPIISFLRAASIETGQSNGSTSQPLHQILPQDIHMSPQVYVSLNCLSSSNVCFYSVLKAPTYGFLFSSLAQWLQETHNHWNAQCLGLFLPWTLLNLLLFYPRLRPPWLPLT